jgi:RNA polymerase sigma factor, sigma-70 family
VKNMKANVTEFLDNELLYMIHQGDEQALQILFKKYEMRIYIMIYQYIGINSAEQQDKEEMKQLAYIKLMQAVNSFREEKITSFAYFYQQILKNAFVDYFRNKSRGIYTVSLQELEAKEGDNVYKENETEKVSINQEELQYLLRKKGIQLKKIEMKVLHLRLQGYSYQEISSSLNISNRQVEYILRKLRNKKNN